MFALVSAGVVLIKKKATTNATTITTTYLMKSRVANLFRKDRNVLEKDDQWLYTHILSQRQAYCDWDKLLLEYGNVQGVPIHR